MRLINNVPIRILHNLKECMNFVENYKIACLGFVQWFFKKGSADCVMAVKMRTSKPLNRCNR